MPEKTIYSVRMRASKGGPHEEGGKHISGGEKLSTYDHLKSSVTNLLDKALSHSRGKPDFLQIQFEKVNEPVQTLLPLPVETYETASAAEGREVAKQLLKKTGVPGETINKVFEKITEYCEPRGAILCDVRTGLRIDRRKNRGVRVSRMDWLTENFEKWARHCHISPGQRMKEALTLATKVCTHPATIAELCWSDDPEYVTGYVASKKYGYQRITRLKEYGDECGCRIFFIDSSFDLHSYIRYLEEQPVFVQWKDNYDGCHTAEK